MQEPIAISTTPPLPGLLMVQQANGAIQTVATDFAGDSDPAAIAPPFSKWANTTSGVLFRRNAAGTAWVEIGRVLERPLYISDGASGVLPTGGFRNKLINGALSINQRAKTGTVALTAGEYGHDRFKAGSGGCTYTFSTANGVTTLNITAGSLIQVVEGSSILSGNHVLSWQGTAQGRINTGPFGSSPVTASLVGGANASVEFGVGTFALPQLESGITPNVFEIRPMGIEMLLARRYYRLDAYQTNDSFDVATPSGGNTRKSYHIGEPMRIASPTTAIDAGNWEAFIGGSWVTMTVNGLFVTSGVLVQIIWNTPGGAPASGTMLVRSTGSFRVILSAEL